MLTSLADTTTLNNGVAMPWFGLGTWKAEDGPEVEQAVGWALELGYRSIDTASAYENEAGVGRAIRNSGIPRDEIFLTTKLWNTDQGYDSALRAFDASLERLGFETVDLYLIHWPGQDKDRYLASWKALERIYSERRARAIGVSNFLVHHLEPLLDQCEVTPAVNQIEFHPRLSQPELLNFCQQHDIQIEAWSPLIRGDVFTIPEFQDVARKYRKTPAQIVLRWDLQHGVVTIPKSVKREHIAANAEVFDFELAPADMATLDDLNADRRTGPHPDDFNF